MTNKDLNYYMSLPYTIKLRPDEEGDWVARVEELDGCSAHAKSPEEAVQRVNEVKELWIADCLETGDPIPEPAVEESLPSGKWLQRVPRTLHARLTQLAKTEAVSLNQLVTSILAQFVGATTQPSKHGPTEAATEEVLHSDQERSIHFYDKRIASGEWKIAQPKVITTWALLFEHLKSTTPNLRTTLEATQNAAKEEKSSHRIGHC